jgi:primosomal protein N' (replication factor Y)
MPLDLTGPANPLYATPTGYSATMWGLPYDDLKGWRGPYPPAVFAAQYEKVAEGWRAGVAELQRAVSRTPPARRADARTDLRFARVDSDTMHQARDYEHVMADFGSGKIQLLMGTQMLAKGLDFPNVTLVGVISGDTALMLPDFRAAERTFQIITQVAGRAGRGQKPGSVILQTFMPNDPTIQAAINQDYIGFAHRELQLRKQAQLPPFNRLVRIIFRDTQEERADALARQVDEKLRQEAEKIPDISVQGPMPCAVSRIAGHYRQQIVMTSPRAASLQVVLAALRKQGDLMKGDRIAIDVDPVSLLWSAPSRICGLIP